MSKYIAIVFLLFLVGGCDNCDDDVNNLLTDFEKGLIPFSENTPKNFIAEDSETVVGNYSSKESEITNLDFGNDGDCSVTNVEREASTLTFASNDNGYNIVIRRSRQNELIFIISSANDNNINFAMSGCDGIVNNIEDLESNIEISGFQFSNVYIFNACSESSEVSRIIYSSANGIEFIEFRDGSYLRLEE